MNRDKPSETKRIVTRWLGIVFGLLALVWLFHIPERPDRVFRAMPENSLLVSEHIDLSGVWRERFDNPLLIDTLSHCGLRHAEDWAADTNIVWIVRLVSGPRSLIGFSPALGPSGKPSWTGASWVGLRGRLLNLMLLTRWIPGVGRLSVTPSGVRYMRLKSRSTQGLFLAFALRENILLATLGEDPEAVRHLDERVRRDAPLAPIFRDDRQPWERSGTAPHRAWVDPVQAPWTLPWRDPVEIGLHVIEPRRLSLELRRRAKNVATSPLPVLAGRCQAADTLAVGAAHAMVMLPYDVLRTLSARYLEGMDLPPLRNRAGGKEDACLYLTSNPYSGRIMNLAVPALTLLMPWHDRANAEDVTALLDRLNAAAGVSLRARPPEPPRERRLTIDWLIKGRPSRFLSGNEGMVAEWHPGWLTFCSSGASLDAQRDVVIEGGVDGSGGLKRKLAAASSGLQGYGRIDLGATIGELRQILAVYRLATAFGMLKVTDEEQRLVDRMADWMKKADRLGTLEAAWWRDDAWQSLALELTGDAARIER